MSNLLHQARVIARVNTWQNRFEGNTQAALEYMETERAQEMYIAANSRNPRVIADSNESIIDITDSIYAVYMLDSIAKAEIEAAESEAATDRINETVKAWENPETVKIQPSKENYTHYLIIKKSAVGVVARDETEARNIALAMGLGGVVERIDIALTAEEWNRDDALSAIEKQAFESSVTNCTIRHKGVVVVWDYKFEYYNEALYDAGQFSPIDREIALDMIENGIPVVTAESARAYVEAYAKENDFPISITAVAEMKTAEDFDLPKAFCVSFKTLENGNDQLFTVWVAWESNALYGEW